MIIWSGRGFLPIIFLIGFGAGLSFILPEDQSEMATSIAFIATGIFSWFTGKKWNGAETKKYTDQSTGEIVTVKPNHSLFWIKMEYWGFIFSALGLFRIITDLLMA